MERHLTEGADKTKHRLIVHAPNVHFGGGAILLSSILKARTVGEKMVLLCDTRMAIDPEVAGDVVVHRFKPTVFGRYAAEMKLRSIAGADDVVLAFGNLPPIYRLPSQTVLFLQHPYLVDFQMPLAGFSPAVRARIMVERRWINSRIGNVDRVIVQTASMAQRFERKFGRKAEIVPFRPTAMESDAGTSVTRPVTKVHDFIYVASSEPHKNHAILLEAWAILAQSGVKPSLALTLQADRDAALLGRVAEINDGLGGKIVNLGRMTPQGVAQAYASSGMLIFPSTGESFGLPLIEAAEMDLPIVASELDYVRDLARPMETFDPRSPRSIARAVRRALNLPDDVHDPVGTRDFLDHLGNGRR